MGPKSRYLGPEVPEEDLIWQDPIPEVDHTLINGEDIYQLKKDILATGMSLSNLIYTAWSSASTFRGSDYRGGANGARIRFSPQINWEVNHPESLKSILSTLESVQQAFNNRQTDNKRISLADMIVLGGCAAIEKAAEKAGVNIDVPFTPGRMDALEAQTDEKAFKFLEPAADGFRNYTKANLGVKPEELLIDKAQLLKLTAPEMTVLVGGMRVLNANYGHSPFGVLTKRPEVLSNDFFINILDMNTAWKPLEGDSDVFEGIDRASGQRKWMATRVDLIFGAHSQLRAYSEVYASDDAKEKFVHDFVHAWNKVMNADRF